METGRRERSGGLYVLLCFLLSLGALLGTANILQAQERTGTIAGELKDASGGVLPGATVVLTNKATGRVTTVVTDGAGNYRADVDPGVYTLRFEMSGFARQEMPDVEGQLGRTFTINGTMKVGNMSEAVQVTAESAPQIDTRSTVIAHNVTAEEIDRMPKARSFQGIALTAPSVNQGEIEGGFQVNGASGAENSYTVDGVVTNSLVNGKSRQDTVFEYLQEVEVKTTGIEAEYGGALGGVISAVTKSGGNTLHGEGHYYFYGSPLGAAPGKRLNLDPVDERTVRYIQDDKQPDNNHELGGSLGGPIVHDRLFFFGSYSPRIRRTENAYQFSNGTEPGVIAQRQNYTQAFGKLTYATSRLTASGAVLFTPMSSEGTLPSYQGSGANTVTSSLASNAINVGRGFEQHQTNANGQVDITLTNRSFLSLR